VSGLFFFPRGGSAQVARELGRALPGAGWQACLAAGSLGRPGELTNACSFFAGIAVEPLDYSPALELADPLAAPVPPGSRCSGVPGPVRPICSISIT